MSSRRLRLTLPPACDSYPFSSGQSGRGVSRRNDMSRIKVRSAGAEDNRFVDISAEEGARAASATFQGSGSAPASTDPIPTWESLGAEAASSIGHQAFRAAIRVRAYDMESSAAAAG
jgi:hypothetical protein